MDPTLVIDDGGVENDNISCGSDTTDATGYGGIYKEDVAPTLGVSGDGIDESTSLMIVLVLNMVV